MFWYEDEISHLEKDTLVTAYEPETIFYGSSTIRLWASLYDDFAALKPINLGFGGSTLAACVWFFDRVMKPTYHPKRLIIYAGDNDLGDGRHPEEVFIFFQQLVVRANKRFGDIPCYYISLKPSASRWSMLDQFKFTNSLISAEIAGYHNNWHFIDTFSAMIDASGYLKSEYFMPDGLHLSENGYQLWKKIVNDYLNANH